MWRELNKFTLQSRPVNIAKFIIELKVSKEINKLSFVWSNDGHVFFIETKYHLVPEQQCVDLSYAEICL